MSGLALTYSIQRSALPEMPLPSVWALYIPALLIYLLLVVATWMLAPHVCRLALKTATPLPAEQEPTNQLSWGEIMIFLTGILLVAWGIDRLADGILPIIQARYQNLRHEIHASDQLGFFVALALTGIGILLSLRFPSVYRWCQKRKLNSKA